MIRTVPVKAPKKSQKPPVPGTNLSTYCNNGYELEGCRS